MSECVAIDAENFEREVLQFPGLVVLDFGASWCAPCRQMEPIIESLARENGDPMLKFGKVDVEASPTIATRYRVQGLPTVVFFRNGEPVESVVGFQGREALQRRIEAHRVRCEQVCRRHVSS